LLPNKRLSGASRRFAFDRIGSAAGATMLLVAWVNVAKLPRLVPDDPRAVVLPLDLPTQAPAYLFSKVEKSVFGTVLAKNGSTGPDFAILRDGCNGTASGTPSDNVWRQSDLVLGRPGIILQRIYDPPERPISLS
jgi:hypothetical protein